MGNYSTSKMKTLLLAVILFNIATFGAAYMDHCGCIADFCMGIQGVDNVQALDRKLLKRAITALTDVNDDDCMQFNEFKAAWSAKQSELELSCTMWDIYSTIDAIEESPSCLTMNEMKRAVKRLKKKDHCPELNGGQRW